MMRWTIPLAIMLLRFPLTVAYVALVANLLGVEVETAAPYALGVAAGMTAAEITFLFRR